MTDYRYTAHVARKWRRLTLTPTSEYRVNQVIDSLMRQRPYGEGFGRSAINGPFSEKQESKYVNLSTSSSPERDLLKGKNPGIQIAGRKPQGRRFKKAPERIKHGTISAATNDCCKCPACKAACNQYMRDYRKAKKD